MRATPDLSGAMVGESWLIPLGKDENDLALVQCIRHALNRRIIARQEACGARGGGSVLYAQQRNDANAPKKAGQQSALEQRSACGDEDPSSYCRGDKHCVDQGVRMIRNHK